MPWYSKPNQHVVYMYARSVKFATEKFHHMTANDLSMSTVRLLMTFAGNQARMMWGLRVMEAAKSERILQKGDQIKRHPPDPDDPLPHA
jgi:hypothetical protein